MTVDDFIAEIEDVDNEKLLHTVVDNFAHSMGMDGAYLFSFHPFFGLSSLDKRPGEWLSYYEKHGYLHFDPIAERAFMAGRSFTWDECVGQSRLTKEQKMLMLQARDFGLKQGYNTVDNSADYHASTCCFYNEDSRDFFEALTVGRVSMDRFGKAAQKKFSELIMTTQKIPHLTSREKQCLSQAARGCSNEDIGVLLGISKNTVNSHIRSACLSLGVRTKIQAVSLAIQLKIIFPLNIAPIS